MKAGCWMKVERWMKAERRMKAERLSEEILNDEDRKQ